MLSGCYKELQTLPLATAKRDCSIAFSIRDVTHFDFFQNFSESLSTKKFKNFETTKSMKKKTLMSAYTLASQILPLYVNAQIL